MRVLLAGANGGSAIENYFVKYFNSEPDVTADIFPAHNIFLSYYHKSRIHKIIFRLGYERIFTTIEMLFKKKVLDFHPDVIFVFKGMELKPKVLKWAKQKGVRIVNYNPDNPFIFSGRGSGNSNVTNSIYLFDIHLTYNHEVKVKMEAEYHIPTYLLPFGFDLDEKVYENVCREAEILRVCFLGNPDKQRAKFLTDIAKSGIKIDVYGNNWNRFIRQANITTFNAVYGNEFWSVLRKYRVQLNLMRIHNPTSHNMRTFEIGGVGGIQLAPDTIDHRMYFEPGKEIFLYRDSIECVLQIKKILALSASEASVIRDHARMRSINSRYTYRDRAVQALNYITGQ